MISGDKPFRWWIEDRWVYPDPTGVPAPDHPSWEVRYDSPFEQGKRTTRELSGEPKRVLGLIESVDQVALWCERLGYPVLPDPSRHGGGLHVTSPEGYLSTHLDYDRHPRLPSWRRALNLIVFLHSSWERDWGGNLELCDPMGRVVKSIEPLPGRLVAFECSDLSYHGVSTVTGPAERVSVACYYLTPTMRHNVRQRALFLPVRSSEDRK